jgi:hypothetical protein
MSKIRTVFVGASHMTRLADEMGNDVLNLAFLGFRPKEKMLTDIVNKLVELKLGKKDIVVVDLLSNVVFMGTDNDGLPTEARRAEDGSYHVVGSLTIAPPLSHQESFGRLFQTRTGPERDRDGPRLSDSSVRF